MQNAAHTIAKLRRLAAGTGNEADTARDILRELEAKNHGAALDADAAEDPIVSLDCPTDGSWHHEQLLCALCEYLGIDALRYKDKRILRKIARGPKSIVESVPKLFESLKEKLEDLHKGTTTGFIIGALPSQPDDTKKANQSKAETLSPDAMAAAMAAVSLGRKATPRTLLPPKAGG